MPIGTKQTTWNRRRFIGGAATLAVSVSTIDTWSSLAQEPKTQGKPADLTRKIKIGLVGCGGRGSWIAKLFQRHGGYEFHAVTDYFQTAADKCGDALGVDRSRRFSTLSGYKRLMESGVEAVVLETPPYCFPEHVRAAVDAGLHVYMAKPVAVDVPGCLAVEAAAIKNTSAKRCFLVDYQIPTDPHNCEVMRRIQAGEIGRIAVVNSRYHAGTFADPAFTENIESRLQRLVWVNDTALGSGYHGNACIHAIDAALWVTGGRPVSATGISRRLRDNPHGDSHDLYSIVFEFADGVIVNHSGKHLSNLTGFDAGCQILGTTGHAQTHYGGKPFLKGRDTVYNGEPDPNIYEAGAVRNIARFYKNVTEGDYSNPTVRRSIDSCLTTILGREACAKRTKITMRQLLRKNKRLEVNLRGLKT